MAVVTAVITATELGEDRSRALGELPLTLELDGVLYCHATPRSDDEILTRLSPQTRWEEALVGVDAALVVAGHTHQQDDRIVGGVRFVNAGSVGLPYEGDAAAAGRRMLEAGAGLGARSINASLLEPEDPDVVARVFESRV